MKLKLILAIALVALVSILGVVIADAQGPQPRAPRGGGNALTAFTYQGQLKQNGAPVNATCDFQFALFDGATGGIARATIQPGAIAVTNGLFTASLDFGLDAFNGQARWLETQVRCPAGNGNFTLLNPRQALTPAPIALSLPGLYTQQNATSPNLIGGHISNTVTSGVFGATIGGGGLSNFGNQVTDDYGTVGGGYNNRAGDNAGTTNDKFIATVGGGASNTASGIGSTIGGGANNTASGPYAMVGGGGLNLATNDSAFIGGGERNTANGRTSVIAGGYYNLTAGQSATIGGGSNNNAHSHWSTIGGGGLNAITTTATYATIAGGNTNNANGSQSAIGGGANNTTSNTNATVAGGGGNTASGNSATIGGGGANTASAQFATVPGGFLNTASGSYSFAAGHRAIANADGNFTFADSNNFDFTSTTANSFRVRATGGIRFVTGIDNTGAVTWSCAAFNGGSWSCSSDRNAKENFVAVDPRATLEKLSQVPILQWNAKWTDPNVKHFGPMSQDFYAAFGLGDDDKTINTIDLDGVALNAIQGLYAMTQNQDAQIAAQKKQIDALETRLAALEQLAQTNRADTIANFAMLIGGALLGIVVLRRF